jgi:hypothetical protein
VQPTVQCYYELVTKIDRYFENATTTALLMEAGLDMMRQNIRRRNANASEATVDALMGAWMRRESDPVPGDTDGAVRVRELHK